MQYTYYWLLNIPWKNIQLSRNSLALDSLPCSRVFCCFQTCLQMVVCFLRWSPIPASHTIQVKLSLRMYEQTTKKWQHSSILLFSQKCEGTVARKTSVCCSISLFILEDSSLVRWKEQIFSFAGVCACYCHHSAVCRRRTNLNSPCSVGPPSPSAGRNSQEGRDKQHKQSLHTGTMIPAALPGLGQDACLLATKVS